jgi:hypothetical protein
MYGLRCGLVTHRMNITRFIQHSHDTSHTYHTWFGLYWGFTTHHSMTHDLYCGPMTHHVHITRGFCCGFMVLTHHIHIAHDLYCGMRTHHIISNMVYTVVFRYITYTSGIQPGVRVPPGVREDILGGGK